MPQMGSDYLENNELIGRTYGSLSINPEDFRRDVR